MRKSIFLFVWSLVFFAIQAQESAFKLQNVVLSDVPLKLVTNSNGSIIISNNAVSAILISNEYAMEVNSTISKQLVNRGIFPDLNAMKVVEYLNPNLGDLSKIQVGQKLILPSIQDFDESQDGLIYLNVSISAAENTKEQIDILQDFLMSVDDQNTANQDIAEQLGLLEGQVLKTKSAMSTGYLELIDRELAQFKGAYDGTNEIMLTSFKSSLASHTSVISSKKLLKTIDVFVLDGNDTIKDCRLFAKNNEFFDQSWCHSEPCLYSIIKFGSPVSRTIYIAEYKVWGMRQDKAVTDTATVDLHNQFFSQVPVYLTFNNR